MPEQNPPVTDGAPAAPAKTDVDAKGVSWENRAKEMERKYRDLEAKVNAPAPQPESRDDRAKGNEQLLQDFVANPVEVMDRHYQMRKFQDELPVAENWLKTQDYFSPEDQDRLGQIIRENGFTQPSPMARARAAYAILKGEKLEREFSDKKREDKISKTAPDSGGKTAPVDGKPNRNDVLKLLAKAQAKRDHHESARLLGVLEDTRK